MHGTTGIWDGTHCLVNFDRRFSGTTRSDWLSFKFKPKKTALATQVIIAHNNRILWTSESKPACINPDITMMRACKDELFQDFSSGDLFLADLGLYSQEIRLWNMFMPGWKKPKGQELNTQQLSDNAGINEFRSSIEHVFAALKNTYTCLKTGYRGDATLFSKAFRICCALYNCANFFNEEPSETVTFNVESYNGDDRDSNMATDADLILEPIPNAVPPENSIWYLAYQKSQMFLKMRKTVLRELQFQSDSFPEEQRETDEPSEESTNLISEEPEDVEPTPLVIRKPDNWKEPRLTKVNVTPLHKRSQSPSVRRLLKWRSAVRSKKSTKEKFVQLPLVQKTKKGRGSRRPIPFSPE